MIWNKFVTIYTPGLLSSASIGQNWMVEIRRQSVANFNLLAVNWKATKPDVNWTDLNYWKLYLNHFRKTVTDTTVISQNSHKWKNKGLNIIWSAAVL